MLTGKRFQPKSAALAGTLSLAVLSWLLPIVPAASAQPDTLQTQQEVFKKVGIDQRLDQQIPLDLLFRDEAGAEVRLGDLFNGRPVLITPVYYSCPMLCNLILNGLVKALKILKFTPGQDFDIITFSINPEEKPDLAQEKKQNYLAEYKRPKAAPGWHFLTGDQASITKLTEAVGFRYAYDPSIKEYAHAAGVIVATPQGKLSHYFYGIEYSPKDIRLALVDAAQGKIGGVIDQFLLLCYHYDPLTGKYGFAVIGFLRLFCALTVAALAAFIIRSLLSERKKMKAGV